MKTTIFNFIAKINELEDQLKQTKAELATVKKLNAVSNSLSGLEIVKKQNEARCKIINELYPPELWKKEIKHVIDKNIVDEWLGFLEGSYDDTNIVEVKDDRFFVSDSQKNKIYFKYYEGLNAIHIQIL